ncbi:hypothetical protein BT69DRAFT_1280246 [Atractiella rhizophila]|nr:hypothetical protein BT69DRAFT_1280246 [Atractiella rhizophila]
MLSRRKTTKQYRDSFLDVSPEIPQLEEEHGFLQSFGGDNGGIDKSPARFFSAPKRHSTWDDFKSSLSSRRTPRKANSTNVFPSYAAPGSSSEVAPQKLVSGRKRSTSNSFSRRASSIPTSSSTGHRSSSIFSSSFTPSTATGQTSLSSASASVENQYENRTERMEDGATSISPSKSDHTISLASYSRTMSAPSPTPILHPYAKDTIGPSPIRAQAHQLSSEEIAPSPIRPSRPEPDRSRQWKGVDEPGSSPSPPRPVRAEGRNHLRQWSAGDEVQLSRVHEPRTSNETAPLLPLRETSPTNLPASPPMISSYSSFSSTTHGPPRPKNDTKPLYMYRYTASPSASYTNTALTRHPSVPLFSPPPHAIASPPVRRRSSLASLPLATPSSSQGAESDYMSCSSTLSHNTPPRKTSIPESLGANGRQRIEDKVREAFRVPMAVKAKLLRSQRSVSASTLKKGGWDFLDVAETTPTTPTKEKVVGLGFEFDATAVGGKGRSVRSRSSLNDLGGRGMRDDTPQLSSVEKRQGLMRMNSDSNFQRRTPRLGDGGYELTGHVYRYASPRNSPRLT